MADDTQTRAARTWWERLSWPQVVFLAILVTGGILAGIFVPLEKLQTIPWDRALGMAMLLLGVAGVAGTKPAIDVAEILRTFFRPQRIESPSIPPPAPRPERIDRTGTGREGFVDAEVLAGIIGLALLALAGAVLFSGCGASAYQTHSVIAAGLDGAAEAGGPAIRAGRQHAGLEAARAVHAAGGDETAARAAAQAELERWEPAVEGHAAFDRAIRMYVRMVLLEGEGLTLERGLALLAPVVEVYQPLARLLDDLSGGTVTIAIPPSAASYFGVVGADDVTAGGAP